MVAGEERGPNFVPHWQPFFNKSRSNVDHSRLIYIHVKKSINRTIINFQVSFLVGLQMIAHIRVLSADLYPYHHECFANTCWTGKKFNKSHIT